MTAVSSTSFYGNQDLLMNQCEIVAVTGDGTNGALSLKRADIGVAVKKNGSKVAQEAANIILLDDNFSTIVVAVKERRTIFRNLEKKIIKTNLSSNITAYAAFIAVYFHNHHLYNHYEKAITVTFISITFGQYANLLSRRTFGNALGKDSWSNPKLLWAFALSISCIMLLAYVPVFNLYFHTSPLLAVDWLFPLLSGAICLIIFEYRKKKTRLD